MTAAAVQPSPSPRGRRSVVARSSRLLLLAVALLALAMAMPRAQAAVGDAQIPDGQTAKAKCSAAERGRGAFGPLLRIASL
jgi:hypothetical protein